MHNAHQYLILVGREIDPYTAMRLNGFYILLSSEITSNAYPAQLIYLYDQVNNSILSDRTFFGRGLLLSTHTNAVVITLTATVLSLRVKHK